MSTRKPILIASSSFDEHTHGGVHTELRRRGYPVIDYLTDRVLNGDDRLQLEVTDAGVISVLYDGHSIGPGAIGAAWYWKVNNFQVANARQNVAKQLTMVNEMMQWNNNMWSLYPDDLWLNSPANTARAERKLGQLVTARAVGFSIPRTMVANDWGVIEAALLHEDARIIIKMLRGVIADQNELRAMYTTMLDRATIDGLRDATVPFPGLFQPFVPKAREWRVTVVGDNVFAAAIYTAEEAKDDWRKLQLTPAVQFRADTLPGEVEDKCRAYLREMNLRYGAIDLVEQPDGTIVFLECNPSGQHNWLEEQLGLPIADAIASELVDLARCSG